MITGFEVDLNQALATLLHLSYSVLDTTPERDSRVRSWLDDIDLVRQMPNWIQVANVNPITISQVIIKMK